jgi:hypothetical protein
VRTGNRGSGTAVGGGRRAHARTAAQHHAHPPPPRVQPATLHPRSGRRSGGLVRPRPRVEAGRQELARQRVPQPDEGCVRAVRAAAARDALAGHAAPSSPPLRTLRCSCRLSFPQMQRTRRSRRSASTTRSGGGRAPAAAPRSAPRLLLAEALTTARRVLLLPLQEEERQPAASAGLRPPCASGRCATCGSSAATAWPSRS